MIQGRNEVLPTRSLTSRSHWKEQARAQKDLSERGDDSARFRSRAKRCRNIAAGAGKDEDWRRWLIELAQELDEDADKIEVEEFLGRRH